MAKLDLSQLDDFSNDFNEVVVEGQTPVWDAVNEYFVPGNPTSIFGSQYQREDEGGNTSTTSSSWQNHQTFNTTVLPAGTYHIEWGYTWAVQKEKDDTTMQVRVRADSVNLYDDNMKDGGKIKVSNTRKKTSFSAEYVVGSAKSLELEIDLRELGHSHTVTMYDSYFIVYRLF